MASLWKWIVGPLTAGLACAAFACAAFAFMIGTGIWLFSLTDFSYWRTVGGASFTIFATAWGLSLAFVLLDEEGT